MFQANDRVRVDNPASPDHGREGAVGTVTRVRVVPPQVGPFYTVRLDGDASDKLVLQEHLAAA